MEMNMNTDMERTVVLEGAGSGGSRDFEHSIIAEAAPSDHVVFEVSRSHEATVSPDGTTPAVLPAKSAQAWLVALTVVGLLGVVVIAALPLVATDIALPQPVASLGLLASVLLAAGGLLGQRSRISADQSQRALELDGQRIEAQRQRDES